MADSEMTVPEMMRVANLHLTLDPRGIEIDKAGRIRFVNPEILQALMTTRPASVLEEADGGTNNSQCSCNISQCGKG